MRLQSQRCSYVLAGSRKGSYFDTGRSDLRARKSKTRNVTWWNYDNGIQNNNRKRRTARSKNENGYLNARPSRDDNRTAGERATETGAYA